MSNTVKGERVVFFQHKNLGSSEEAIGGGLKALKRAVSSHSPWAGDPWSSFTGDTGS